ncbi:MAG: glycosyltransferase [Methanocorpusculum sp.]|uniref:glycosyltransferase n=1 Tax=Methanocorpusculum sp. TaxID=2058474 RepID=UPI00271DA301|nr:glycosyltransferase [Methanocorpusculum sp.]MDO9523668.1 glycosyltransferase [Methanocorpusculum sp.]
MFLYLLPVGAGIILLAVIPYIVYLFGVTFGKKPVEMDLDIAKTLPAISIVICAYNEERTIARKIQSISSCTYPNELMEVVLVIDYSDDKTEEVARSELVNVDFSWKIYVNKQRFGKNTSLNTGIGLTANELIVATDADLVWDTTSVEHLVRRILADDKFAAGTGDLQPNPGADRVTSMEKTYRSYFGRMAEWESAHDATPAFNGCLLIMRKSIVDGVNETSGADDANLAFEAIRKGYRTFYETRAAIYEELPENLKKQYTQKVRRAKGLIQTTLANRDLLEVDRPFCRIFYPLRLWMYVITPTMLLIGGIIFSIGLLLNLPLLLTALLIAFLLFSVIKKGNLMTAFVTNQFYLLAGFYSRKNNAVLWKSTSKKVGE